MKSYRVSTQSAVNSCLIHSIGKSEFISKNYNDAKKIFDEEVEYLRKCYTAETDLGYSPSDNEQSNAIYCSIVSNEEDGDQIFIEDSELFYDI